MATYKIPRYVLGDNQPDITPIKYNYAYTVTYQENGRDVVCIEYPAHQLPFIPRINEQVVLDANMFNKDTSENLQLFDVKEIVSVMRVPRLRAKMLRTDIFVRVSLNVKDEYRTVDQKK